MMTCRPWKWMPTSRTNKLPTDSGYKCSRLHRQVTIKAHGWLPGHRTWTGPKGMLHRKCNNTNQTKFYLLDIPSNLHMKHTTFVPYSLWPSEERQDVYPKCWYPLNIPCTQTETAQKIHTFTVLHTNLGNTSIIILVTK